MADANATDLPAHLSGLKRLCEIVEASPGMRRVLARLGSNEKAAVIVAAQAVWEAAGLESPREFDIQDYLGRAVTRLLDDAESDADASKSMQHLMDSVAQTCGDFMGYALETSEDVEREVSRFCAVLRHSANKAYDIPAEETPAKP
jgi:hypothetical protein